MKYIVNATSWNMVNPDVLVMRRKPINPADVPADVTSAIGHKETADIVSKMVGFPVSFNRVTIRLTKEDVAYLAQYDGPRLPEGCTELPAGARLDFFEVTFE